MNLILTPEHRYLLDGKQIDGLTSTLEEAGLIDTSFYTEESAEKGTDIHKETERYDFGEDFIPQLDTAPYLASWILFRKRMNYEPTEIEFVTFHPILMVGMTIDRLPGPVEIKSGAYAHWHKLQLAAQWACAYIKNPYQAKKPMLVYLNKEGKEPKVKLFTEREMREEFSAYTSFVGSIRWKRRNK